MVDNKRIIDAFIFCDEVDYLKSRLETLDEYVDYFVILESNYFTNGKQKESFFEKNKKIFSKWENKIIRLEYDASKRKNKKNIIKNQFLLIKKIIYKLKLKYDDIFILSKVSEVPNLKEFDDVISSLVYEPVILLNKKNIRGSVVFQYTHLLQDEKVIDFYLKNKNKLNSTNYEIIENGWIYESPKRQQKKIIKINLDLINSIEAPKTKYYESENFDLEFRVNQLKKLIYSQNPIDDDIIIFEKKITSNEVIWRDLKNSTVFSFVKNIF